MMLAILQARTSSTRLPGKVLKPILGKPMLERQLDRLARVRQIDKLVVATSEGPDDNALAELCDRIGFKCFRGSLNDVLDRFYQTAKIYNARNIIRLTGDCPVADPQIIDEIISHYLSGNFDYVSNTIEPTYPDGLDAEVFRYECLEQAWHKAKLPSQREHVTPFIWQQPDRFKLENHRCEDHPGTRQEGRRQSCVRRAVWRKRYPRSKKHEKREKFRKRGRKNPCAVTKSKELIYLHNMIYPLLLLATLCFGHF